MKNKTRPHFPNSIKVDDLINIFLGSLLMALDWAGTSKMP